MILRNPNKTTTFCSLCRHSLWWFSTHVMEQVQAIQTSMEMEWEITICFGCVQYFTTVSSGACIMMPKLLDRYQAVVSQVAVEDIKYHLRQQVASHWLSKISGWSGWSLLVTMGKGVFLCKKSLLSMEMNSEPPKWHLNHAEKSSRTNNTV